MVQTTCIVSGILFIVVVEIKCCCAQTENENTPSQCYKTDNKVKKKFFIIYKRSVISRNVKCIVYIYKY